MSALVDKLRTIVGERGLITDAQGQHPYLTDWRRRYTGAACAVLCPATPDEVAALVRLAVEHRIALVPQGGNTGLAGGATPDASGAQAVISLRRLNRVRDIDPRGRMRGAGHSLRKSRIATE